MASARIALQFVFCLHFNQRIEHPRQIAGQTTSIKALHTRIDTGRQFIEAPALMKPQCRRRVPRSTLPPLSDPLMPEQVVRWQDIRTVYWW